MDKKKNMTQSKSELIRKLLQSYASGIEKKLQEQIDTLQSDYAKQEELLNHIRQENEIYKEKMNLLDSEKNELSALLIEKDHIINDLQIKISQCIEKEIELQSRCVTNIEMQQNERNKNEETITKLKETLQEKESHIAKMQKEQESTPAVKDQALLTELQATRDTLNREREDLQTQLFERDEDIKLITALCDEKDAEINNLKEEMHALITAREEEMQMVKEMLRKKPES